MTSTEDLIIITDLYQKEEISLHPNIGFDLGLMNSKYRMKIFPNTVVEAFNKGTEGFIEGTVVLDNKCKDKIIKISHLFWKKIGKPKKARIFIENDKMLLAF